MISHAGMQFTKSAEFNDLLKRLNIARDNAAVEHQQANGEVVAMVRLMKPLLHIKAENNTANWPFCLDEIMAARNSAKSSSTGKSPYYVLFGYEPVIDIEAEYRNFEPQTASRFREVNKKIAESKQAQEKQYN